MKVFRFYFLALLLICALPVFAQEAPASEGNPEQSEAAAPEQQEAPAEAAQQDEAAEAEQPAEAAPAEEPAPAKEEAAPAKEEAPAEEDRQISKQNWQLRQMIPMQRQMLLTISRHRSRN